MSSIGVDGVSGDFLSMVLVNIFDACARTFAGCIGPFNDDVEVSSCGDIIFTPDGSDGEFVEDMLFVILLSNILDASLIISPECTVSVKGSVIVLSRSESLTTRKLLLLLFVF